MESNQRNLRRAAAQAFMESLDKLQETLAVEASSASESDGNLTTDHRPADESATVSNQPASAFDLASLEQAVADIEQFIQAQEGRDR